MFQRSQVQGRGIIRGLQVALQGFFARLSTVPNQCSLDEMCHVVLPVQDWHLYEYYHFVQIAGIAIGAVTDQVIYTCPADRRAIVYAAFATREAGDNTFAGFVAVQPAGYGLGSRSYDLLRMTTSAADIWWPNRTSTVTREVPPGQPIYLEPGGTIAVALSGAGVATTDLAARVIIRLSPMIRARVP